MAGSACLPASAAGPAKSSFCSLRRTVCLSACCSLHAATPAGPGLGAPRSLLRSLAVLRSARGRSGLAQSGQVLRPAAPLRLAPRAQAEFGQTVRSEQWEQRRQQVTAFVEQHGRLPRQVGSQREPLLAGERQLGRWCGTQRQRWKGKQQPPLSAKQQAALEAIPGWVWEEQMPWEQRRQQVAAFVEQHGRLPRTEGSKKEPLLAGERQLGVWCNRQQQRRKGQQQPPLSAKQQAALEAIPGWSWWGERANVAWEQRRQQVLAFVERQGRLPRRRGSQQEPLLEGERQLGNWCSVQRQRWKGKQQPPLTAEQQAALEAIPGWVLGGRELWEQRRQQVLAFVEQHGRLPRRQGSQQEPLLAGEQQLGNWCSAQRQRWKGKQQPPLTAEQQAALEAIPGWIWGGRELWEQQRQQVAAFAAQHGRLPRTQGSKRDPLLAGERQLGHWCHYQRQRWNGNRQPPLTAGQQAALEGIPLWRW